MEKLFVYGTLKEPEIQKEAIGRIAGGVPDVLKKYRKTEMPIDGENYPVIVPDENGVVYGLILEVSPEELKMLDDYEVEYKRIEVVLEGGTSAWVYVKK
ncbi:MAG: gamma-glutamylcyclotransferase family protein [Candidatus Jorgensenbacteria bacterium]